MMKKQLLFTGLALAFGVSATSYLYLEKKSDKAYTERAAAIEEEHFSLAHLRLDQNGELNPLSRVQALESVSHRASRATPIGLNFSFRGPDNVGGRTRALIELIGKPDTLLAGGMTGGLFVSKNGGAYWQPHPQFQNLATSSAIVSSIAQDTVTGTIYVGTGSSFDAGGTNLIEMPGYGMYKSEDNGVTFTHIESTVPENRLDYGDLWTAINRIAIAPNGDIYAATESGLWASKDGGDSWFNPIYSDPNFTIPATGVCADVVTTKAGRVIAAFSTGAIHISDDGEDKSFVRPENSGLPTGGIMRSVLAMYDDDIMYVGYTSSADQSLQGIYKTIDGGETWSNILTPFDDFTPYCSSAQCQGDYDACLAVSPIDPNTIFIGGVEIWRFDGSLTRVASEGGAPPASDVLPFYVHADKHFIYFSPNDPRRMYVSSDGGITMTMNRGRTWQGINKGYSTTQFYGVAFAPEGGVLLGGTQDNGSLAIPNDNLNDPFYGVQANGGDGFDADISQASGIYFATSQYGVLVRGENNLPSAALEPNQDRSSPFWTVTKLWESTNDPTSQDSIIFNNDSIEQSIAVSNGAVKAYRETIAPVQAAAKIIRNSIRVFSGDQRFSNKLDATALVGDGTGSVIFEDDGSFTVDVSFTDVPSENSNIFVQYAVRYKANDILIIESDNLNANLTSFFFEHRLENALNPGDKVIIQDPVQSLVAKSVASGLGMYRGVLNMQELPELITIQGVGGGMNGIEFSSDGGIAYVASNSAVYRVRGLHQLYTQEDADRLYASDTSTLVTNIFSANGGQVTGLSIDPNDDGRLIVAVSGYGNDENVVELTNATSGSATRRVLHGDLPLIPVYDIEIDANDPNLVLIGTEFGIWASKDVSASSVEWTDENNSLTYVPIFDIRQQRLPFDQAKNSGVYYIGTYGRGIWESSSLVGIGDFPNFDKGEGAISNFKVYPNPISDVGTIEYETSFNGNATITIYDLNGRVVKSWNDRAASGTNRSPFNASTLRSGSYFATLEVNGQSEASKFIVLK